MRDPFTTCALPFVLLAFFYGCASSDGYSEQTLTCDKSYQMMWSAATTVVFWMDGRVEVENNSGGMGMIMATLPLEDMGTEIRIYIELTRLPGGDPSFPAPVTVTVKAVDPQISEPDNYLKDLLDTIMKLYLEGVAARSGCISPIEKLPH